MTSNHKAPGLSCAHPLRRGTPLPAGISAPRCSLQAPLTILGALMREDTVPQLVKRTVMFEVTPVKEGAGKEPATVPRGSLSPQ